MSDKKLTNKDIKKLYSDKINKVKNHKLIKK